jgi:hypothetical protein
MVRATTSRQAAGLLNAQAVHLDVKDVSDCITPIDGR